MIKNSTRSRLRSALFASASFAVAALAPSISLAQTGVPEAAASPSPSESQPGTSSQGDRIIITGSNIPVTADEVGFSPVTTFDRQQIDRGGSTSVSDVLSRLPQNTGGSFDETLGNSFAPGSSGVSLRGLGQNATLTLLNGRRVAPYAFAQNITDAFTDLNSIPLAAVERIEVLKDGATPLYGADAVAGVVNVVLRDSFDGAEFSIRYGNTTQDNDIGEFHTSLVTGYNGDKLKVLLTADYLHRNGSKLVDHEYSESADTSRGDIYGNPKDITVFDPRYIFYTTDPLGIDFRSSRSFPGRFSGPTIGLISTIPGTTGQSLNDYQGGYIPYDYNANGPTDRPEIDRYGLFGRASYQVNDWFTPYVELLYNRSFTKVALAPTPIENTGPGGLYIPATNPYNPFGINFGLDPGTGFRYRAVDAGPREDKIDAEFDRVLVGGKFTLPGSWSLDTSAMYSRSRVQDEGHNFLSVEKVQAALDATDPRKALNFFSGKEGANKNVIDQVKANTLRDSTAELSLFDAKLNGPVLDLPAGPLYLALGTEYREERLADSGDPRSKRFDIVGSGGVSGNGEREIYAGYVEVDVPIFSPTFSVPFIYSLDFQVAERYENYSDFGSSATPKFAIKYNPIKDLAFRASYSEGVRAPSLPELNSTSTNFAVLVDPQGKGGGPDYEVDNTSGPLQPETSYSYSAGAVYTPSYLPGLTIDVNFFRIEQQNLITTLGPNFILANEASLPGAVVRDPGTGEILRINDRYLNLGEVETDGIDFEVNYVLPTKIGEFTFDAQGTYVNSYEVLSGLPSSDGRGFEPRQEYVDTSAFGSNPEFVGNASLFWKYEFGQHTETTPIVEDGKTIVDAKSVKDAKDGKDSKDAKDMESKLVGVLQTIELGVTVNYTDSYDDTDLGLNDVDDVGGQHSPIDRVVQSYTTVDLQASYSYGNSKLTVGVDNVFDEDPPFSFNDTSNYDPSLADSKGRFWYVEFTQKF